MRGADPPSGVATASHRQGRAAAPPRATQAPRGCAGATLSPEPLRNVPQPTWGCRWLCTLPPATLPTTGPPLSPKRKHLLSLAEAGEAVPPGHCHLAATTTASGCRAGPQSWDRQRKRVSRPHSAEIPLANAGRGLPGKLLHPQLPEVPSEAAQGPPLVLGQQEAVGSRGEWQEPAGSCSQALSDNEGVGEGMTPEQKGQKLSKGAQAAQLPVRKGCCWLLPMSSQRGRLGWKL